MKKLIMLIILFINFSNLINAQLKQKDKTLEKNKEFSLWYWDNIITYDDQIKPKQRLSQIFDKKGRVLNQLKENWKIDKWSNFEKNSYIYNLNSNLNICLNEYFIDGEWEKRFQYNFTYDEKGNKLTNIYSTLIYDTTMSKVWSHSYTYNIKGNVVSDLFETTINNEVQKKKIDYNYDANDNLLSELTSELKKNNWELVNKSSFSYSRNNDLLLKVDSHFYIYVGTKDHSVNKTTLTYNERGYPEIYLFENIKRPNEKMNKIMSDLVDNTNDLRLTYEYDKEGNNTKIFKEIKINDKWIAGEKIIYNYDKKGNVAKKSIEYPNNSKNTSYCITTSYDLNGNKLSDLYEVNTNNIWNNYAHITFSYDNFGNSKSAKYETWVNSVWKSSKYDYLSVISKKNDILILDNTENDAEVCSYKASFISIKINESNNENNIKYNYNPLTKIISFFIYIKDLENVSLEKTVFSIYSIDGQLIFLETLLKSNTICNFFTMKEGMYILKVKSNKEIIKKTIIL